ncbi:hypothetical protein KZP23_09770 [Echinicola marina]|uniref:hypothetical protein n=1 Tax=Echinicola marina TaxID=2859768 RepID=UPI001CF71AB7|nr:hypothetical protein [Echinicola marina]UCS95266.1 hypothetical protein KZP23_09770 [Echinicola marina]
MNRVFLYRNDLFGRSLVLTKTQVTMINEPNILRFQVAPVLGNYKWIGSFVRVMRGIAIVIFLIPFVLRIFVDISLEMYFLMFFGCWVTSIFLMLVAEMLAVWTEPGYFDLE